MTYCVGMLLKRGLVMASDSRTNAGVDDIATYRKMAVFERPGQATIILLAAGNLSLTQSAVSVLTEWIDGESEEQDIFKTRSMYRVARIVGESLREVFRQDAEALKDHNTDFHATFILGGQVKGERPRLFHIYTPGNFVEATPDTPFFQIGETKYGRPVFDRLLNQNMPLEQAAKLALISFDSTMRSNLSVGLPIDLVCYETDALKVTFQQRFGVDNSYMKDIRRGWGEGLRSVFDTIDPPALETPIREPAAT